MKKKKLLVYGNWVLSSIGEDHRIYKCIQCAWNYLPDSAVMVTSTKDLPVSLYNDDKSPSGYSMCLQLTGKSLNAYIIGAYKLLINRILNESEL